MSDRHVVLVVEDEEDSRETLRSILALEGYDVETASNGVEALERLECLDGKRCVMLLDLHMPVMNGQQVLERLREDVRLRTVKVVITSSASHQAPRGYPIIPKPLDLSRVLATLKALCYPAVSPGGSL